MWRLVFEGDYYLMSIVRTNRGGTLTGRGKSWQQPMNRGGWQTCSCLPAFLKRWMWLNRDNYSLIRSGTCLQTMRTLWACLGSSICPSLSKTLASGCYMTVATIVAGIWHLSLSPPALSFPSRLFSYTSCLIARKLLSDCNYIFYGITTI